MNRPQSERPLPDNAHLAFHGEIFDVYQWEQAMFDGSTAVFEKLARADTVVVVPVTDEGRILIVDEEQPAEAPRTAGLPSGRLEEGEEPLSGAARELLEETGYEARELAVIDAYQPYGKIEWAVFVIIARGCRKVAEQRLDAGERITVREISFDEFAALAKEASFAEPHLSRRALAASYDPREKESLRRDIYG